MIETNLVDRLNQFVDSLPALRQKCLTEEATKHSLVLPFLDILDYNVFNPAEVIPEFISDVGTKKGEKVDYAILKDGEPCILVEVKYHKESLDRHIDQLYRYFSVTKAKFAILTNGIEYLFYTDLDEVNKLDQVPFLRVDLLNLRPSDINELKKFSKPSFDPDKIFTSATFLKYVTQYKNLLSKEFESPSKDFVEFFARQMYPGKRLTSGVLDEFKEVIQKGTSQYFNEIVNKKLTSALNENESQLDKDTQDDESDEAGEKQIVTTQMELEGYYIIKSIVGDVVEPGRVSYKDTFSYFSINLDNKTTKWFCRLYFNNPSKKQIALADVNKKPVMHKISSLNDIYSLRDEIKSAVTNYL